VPDLESLTADGLADDAEWWRIYGESFRAEAKEPPEAILKSLRTSAGIAFRVRRDGVTTGIATTHLLLDPAAVFLVYLAIDARHRRRGDGRTLFEFAWTESSTRLRAKGSEPIGMIWEVDEEARTPDLKFRFFERQGATLLSRPYRQPPVNGAEPVPMRLMFRPAIGKAVPAEALIEALVREIYFAKYGAVNGISAPLLERLLKSEGPSQ
jgi:hypothetical protein